MMNHSTSCMCSQCLCVTVQKQNIAQRYAPPMQWEDIIFHRLMSAPDLGIVDELLDDKVGMEP